MKRRFAVPLTAIALGLSMSACGGDSKDDATSTTPPSAPAAGNPAGGGTTPAAPPTQQGGGTITGNGGGGGNLTPAQKRSLTRLVECMRKKGYDMPDVGDSPAIAPKNTQGMDPNKVNKDSQECVAQSQGG